jgi:SAM-dependent methyltransferase
MSAVRRLGKTALWPVRRLLDPRFADVARRIEYASNRAVDESHRIESQLSSQQAELTLRVDTFGAASNESLAFVGRQIREFEGALSDLTDRVRVVEGLMDPIVHARKMQAVIDGGVDGLDADTARLLNFAESHRGFAAQRELWTNPPLSLAYAEGDVRIGSINERIVEGPFTFRALSSLEPPAAILDFGSVESTLPLSLAALGYRVCALDLRPYPFMHPNLEVVVSRLEDFDRAPASFDAITCVSTIEHVGLGWYGEVRQDVDADRRAIERLGELLKPSGLLVLTVPFGRASVDGVQRVYDDAGLAALLDGWDVVTREVVRQHDATTWVPGEVADPDSRAVAMVAAHRGS